MPKVGKKVKDLEDDKKDDGLFIGQADDKRLIVQMHKDMWQQLRKLSFELEISMAELCREGLNYVLEKNRKILAK